MAFFSNPDELTHEEKVAYFTPLISNPVLLEDGRYDCDFDHPDYGTIPFTANSEDSEEHGRIIHEICAGMQQSTTKENNE